jgi:hypothetical protein
MIDAAIWGSPLGVHALLLAYTALMRGHGQFYDHGQIPIDLTPLQRAGAVVRHTLNSLLEEKAFNGSDCDFRQVVRTQLVFVPIMRFTAFAPAFLYCIGFLLWLGTQGGVQFGDWDHKLVSALIFGAAFLLQIVHLALKTLSGMAEQLHELHPDYHNRNLIAIITDWTALAARKPQG